MSVHVDLTPEEASELEAILPRELGDIRVELRRTREVEYHQRIARRMEMLKRMLEAVAAAAIHTPT